MSRFFLCISSFTVVRSSQPVTVKAEYGPFETSQMVPTQYLVPDLIEEDPDSASEASEAASMAFADQNDNGNRRKKVVPPSPALITDFKPHQLDLSAHLVTNEVRDHSSTFPFQIGGNRVGNTYVVLLQISFERKLKIKQKY